MDCFQSEPHSDSLYTKCLFMLHSAPTKIPWSLFGLIICALAVVTIAERPLVSLIKIKTVYAQSGTNTGTHLSHFHPRIHFQTAGETNWNVTACIKITLVLYFSYCQQIPGQDQNQQSFIPSFNTFWLPESVRALNTEPISPCRRRKSINVGHKQVV